MIIEFFKQITKIPRCSGTHLPFIAFMQNISSQYNYICKIDNAYNILCYKDNSKSKICMQSHYDIVCLEDNTIPEIIIKDNILKAKNSTLGADNGIGCAYMVALMSKGYDCEYLFTCDEEIGLIGANNLDLNIKSKNMLNIDSESMGEVCIGCAGGIDIFASTSKSKLIHNTQNKNLYEIEVSTNMGGHSGIEIHKNIPNAIKLLVDVFKDIENIDLIDINGGERLNSIPKYAKAIIASDKYIKSTNKYVTITKINNPSEHYKILDKGIITFISSMQNGVLKFDNKLNVVIDSINLALISTNINDVKISISARSMDNDNLNNIATKTINDTQKLLFKVYANSKNPAWKPDINDFTNDVIKIYKKYFKGVSLYAIHAGLECAIFKEKYPHLNIVSIGPNIFSPHSNAEYCDINSVNKVFEILEDIASFFTTDVTISS
jgi:dipeptidase D